MELLNKIELLRGEMNSLATSGAEYELILGVSQLLDVYIVQYQKERMNACDFTENVLANTA